MDDLRTTEDGRHQPRLVYASTSGFGHRPHRQRGAIDAIVQGMGGVMSMTGHVGACPPAPGTHRGHGGGMYTAIGVLSALVERDRSGLGQHVDVAMLDAQVALMENAIVRYTSTGQVQGPVGLRHPLSTPHQAFPAKDGWVVVANVKDHNWPLFCGLLGCDELATDERFATNPVRTRNYAALEPILFRPSARQGGWQSAQSGRPDRADEWRRRGRGRPPNRARMIVGCQRGPGARYACEHAGEALAHAGRRNPRGGETGQHARISGCSATPRRSRASSSRRCRPAAPV
jgi:hypothetical protein